MVTVSIQIPEEFLPALDELVMQTGAGLRETWVRNVVGNILIDYQLKKDFAPQLQTRQQFLLGLWQ
jgi:metal-responsive CopG/Arc/MetJ family transcriptional regulator